MKNGKLLTLFGEKYLNEFYPAIVFCTTWTWMGNKDEFDHIIANAQRSGIYSRVWYALYLTIQEPLVDR